MLGAALLAAALWRQSRAIHSVAALAGLLLLLLELELPHPRIAEREFVLRPLHDIAPAWRHPQTGQTVATMLAQLPHAAQQLQEKL